jgi:hypothetical protein
MENSQIERTEYIYCGQSPSGSLDEKKERKGRSRQAEKGKLSILARRLRDDVSNMTGDTVTWNPRVQGLESSGKDRQTGECTNGQEPYGYMCSNSCAVPPEIVINNVEVIDSCRRKLIYRKLNSRHWTVCKKYSNLGNKKNWKTNSKLEERDPDRTLFSIRIHESKFHESNERVVI